MHYDKSTLLRLACLLLAVGAASRAALALWRCRSLTAPPRLGGATPEGIEFFETHIRPVLVEKCYSCHSADAKVLQGGLRLDTAERMRAGGESGAGHRAQQARQKAC